MLSFYRFFLKIHFKSVWTFQRENNKVHGTKFRFVFQFEDTNAILHHLKNVKISSVVLAEQILKNDASKTKTLHSLGSPICNNYNCFLVLRQKTGWSFRIHLLTLPFWHTTSSNMSFRFSCYIRWQHSVRTYGSDMLGMWRSGDSSSLMYHVYLSVIIPLVHTGLCLAAELYS